MNDLFGTVLSWKALLAAMLVFGFAPGVILRIIVRSFHRDDPRRDELLAELRIVPFLERPLWVAQQLEVAIFEGLWERFFDFAAGRLFWRPRLESGVENNRKWPDSFWIPSDEEKAAIVLGDHVKIGFRSRDNWGERMWFEVTKIGRRRLVGRMLNWPHGVYGINPDHDTVKFRLEHVIDIIDPDDDDADIGPCVVPELDA